MREIFLYFLRRSEDKAYSRIFRCLIIPIRACPVLWLSEMVILSGPMMEPAGKCSREEGKS